MRCSTGSSRLIRTSLIGLLFAVPGLALSAVAPTVAGACSLDGIASISVDGDLAVRTTDAPSAATLARWAPFTFGLAFAPGAALRFAEDLGKVRRSLPAAAFAVPFRWSYGDGQTASGMQVTHRYEQIGWFRVTVRSYWPSRHTWVLFDSAQIHILPAAALWQANFGYRIVLALQYLTRALAYGGWIIIFLIPIAWQMRRRRRPRLRAAGVTQNVSSTSTSVHNAARTHGQKESSS